MIDRIGYSENNAKAGHIHDLQLNSMSQILLNIKDSFDACFRFSNLIENNNDKNLLNILRDKKIKVRIITEIAKSGLSWYKELSRYAEVYHLSPIKGDFIIADKTNFYYTSLTGNQHQMINIADKSFIEIQQFLFENLLNRADQAKDRIKNIEKELEGEFTNTIQKAEVINLIFNKIRQASFELLVFFSTVNSFYRAENDGIIRALGEASRRDVKIRVLVKTKDDSVKETMKKIIKQKDEKIRIQFFYDSLQSVLTTFIIDKTYSIAMEIDNDNTHTSTEAINVASYSNSESTISSFVSMFESLWIQAELEMQQKIKHAYFQIFKGFQLKDEVYNRKWAFEQNNNVQD